MSAYSDIPGPETSTATLDGSFQPVDLAGAISGSVQQPIPTMLTRRGDGIESGLIYPGVVNGLHGDSGTGKSWLALLLLAERIKNGENVMLVDLEDTPASIVTRLRLLEITDNELMEQLTYIQPTEAFGPLEVEHLINIINEHSITVVVIDSLGEAFGTEGIDEDRDKDVGPWLRSVARPLATAGPAVVLIDHSTKSKERQLHASGSKRKRAAIGGASYLVEAVTGFAKGKSGRLRVICAKDRHGTYRRSEHVAWLDMTTHPDGTVTLELIAPASKPNIPEGQRIQEAVIRVVGDADQPISKNQVAAAVRTNKIEASSQKIADAIEMLLMKRTLSSSAGAHNAILLSIANNESS